MPKGWLALVVISALAVFAVVGAYSLHFGPQSGWHLSADPEDWARFGEYVGGIFGTLAFGGVLVTINLQREQLDEQRKQFGLQEIQRFPADFSKRVDEILASEASGVTDALRRQMRHRGASMSVFEMLSGIGTSAMRPSDSYLVQGRRKQIHNQVVPIITRNWGLVVIELQQLVVCLQDYELPPFPRTPT
jgi:hypothetical protein